MVSRREHGHPHRRVRPLHRLWHQIAARHVEPAPPKSGIRPHRQHVGSLSSRLLPHRPLVFGIDAKAAHLDRRRRLAGSPFDAAVRHQIERRDAFGDARRMIVIRGHQCDAVAEADAFGALRAGGEEHLRRRGVRVFLKEMMLDLPDVVDPEPIGELDLDERLLIKTQLGFLAPGLRQLVLVKKSEFHRQPPGGGEAWFRRSSAGPPQRPRRACRARQDGPRRRSW
jgi:hypothetical protein